MVFENGPLKAHQFGFVASVASKLKTVSVFQSLSKLSNCVIIRNEIFQSNAKTQTFVAFFYFFLVIKEKPTHRWELGTEE